jgi:hypothetical protein
MVEMGHCSYKLMRYLYLFIGVFISNREIQKFVKIEISLKMKSLKKK